MSKTANLPKVTIITVTYNAEATLERTLQSVAALDYAPFGVFADRRRQQRRDPGTSTS